MKKRAKKVLSLIMVTLLMITLFAQPGALAWSGSYETSNTIGHGLITIDAYNFYTTFKDYLNTNSAYKDILLDSLCASDTEEGKAEVAHLDNTFTNVDIWEHPGSADSVVHCWSTIEADLTQDPRLHNALECLNVALRLKASGSPGYGMRIFGYGLHLMQDYFAHLNAPGASSTVRLHGIPDSYSVNGTPVNDLIDNLNWDNHRAGTGSYADVYNTSFWHYNSNRANNWRYQAAYNLTVEFMQCYVQFLDDDSVVAAYNSGLVYNGSVTTHIDILALNPAAT